VVLGNTVAPDWRRDARWDILAKLPDGASQDQIPEMLQALLVDRFKLVVHRENKELQVYELGVAQGGPKMKASEPDTANSADSAPANGPFGFSFGPPPPPRPPGGPGRGAPNDGPGRGGAAIISPPKLEP